MLPKANRLLHRRDFQRVYQHGTRVHSPHLTVRALALPLLSPVSDRPVSPQVCPPARPTTNPTPAPTRIGIVVSQKAAGKRAVVRNRVKRRIRAACRCLLPRTLPGWLLVISARNGSAECDYDEFLQELEQLLVKTGVLSIHGYS